MDLTPKCDKNPDLKVKNLNLYKIELIVTLPLKVRAKKNTLFPILSKHPLIFNDVTLVIDPNLSLVKF